ncbi:Plasmodium exported protein, unknown function [Plasmodium vivax]|uniref:VIR protein n=1 Tax=Plasmodium vivax TaxID=5855 RepID=A0A565A649_PLAVI|nr:Plasmodium exported protein, unknown function [Plasmodium vivax]
MVISKRTHMTHRRSLYFFTIINTFIKSLENRGKLDISLDIRTHRLLAKHEYQNEFPSTGVHNRVSYNRDNYKLEKGKGSNNTFQQLKKGRSNHVDDYMKSYKNRYSKKRGLKKLDCYYERLLFNSFNKLNKIVKDKNVNVGRFNRFICTKYGLPLILLSLLPLLAFAAPEIIIGKVHSKKVDTCTFTVKTTDSSKLATLTHEGCNYDEVKGPYLR